MVRSLKVTLLPPSKKYVPLDSPGVIPLTFMTVLSAPAPLIVSPVGTVLPVATPEGIVKFPASRVMAPFAYAAYTFCSSVSSAHAIVVRPSAMTRARMVANAFFIAHSPYGSRFPQVCSF